MLNEYEIKNIISIDDGWNIAGELEEKIEKAGNDLNVTIKDFCDMYGIEIVAEEAEAYKECSYMPIKESENVKSLIPQTFLVICETLQVDIDASLKTLKSILCQLEGMFNIYTGVKFESSYQTLEGNTLYILDKDMGENRENEFLDYIVNIIEERKAYNDLVIVYSHEVAGLLEHDKKVV